jgi:hypothetical protein
MEMAVAIQDAILMNSYNPDKLYTRDDFIRLGACADGVKEFADEHFPDETAVTAKQILECAYYVPETRYIKNIVGLSGYGDGDGYGYGDGDGYGYGDGYGDGDGDGYGDGDGDGDGYGK